MGIPTTRWRPLIETVVTGLIVPAVEFEAMVLVESNGDPNARSDSDARGLAQLIPRWHKDGIGKKVAAEMGRPLTDSLWFDPEFSLRCGSRHLAWCFVADGSRSWERAVRAYFTGTPDPPAGFTNAQGTSAEQHIQKFREAVVRVRADRQAAPAGDQSPSGGDQPMVDHVYVFSMGHRNAGPDINGNPARGGAPGEADWTPKCVRMVTEEFRDRGARVFIAQEADGDDDPNDSWPMKREAVARLSARVAKEQGAIAYLSFHYNGSGGTMPGFHAVVPDAVGSGVGNLISNNPKDVRLAQAIAERLRATGTVSIHKDGVYSEFDTGAVAGEPGARLGELKGTLSIREQAVRLILEAADFSTAREKRFLQDDDWVRNTYAVAVADGCADVFGPFPNPDGRPADGFAGPLPVPDLAAFVANGALIETPPEVVTVASGERMEFVNRMARAIRNTPRRQFGSQAAPSVGPDIAAGQTFTVAWRYLAGDGNTYFLTPFWTRVLAADVELVG